MLRLLNQPLSGPLLQLTLLLTLASLPPGHRSTAHAHGAIEIFYVVSGVMNHVVNGEAHRLDSGMVGIVGPGERLRTKSSAPNLSLQL